MRWPRRAGGSIRQPPRPSFASRTSGAWSPSRDALSGSTASLKTGIRKRDRHLRSADFFDAQNHPEMQFRSTRVTDAGDGRFRVEGDLEVAGKHVALDLETTIRQTDDQLDIKPARPSTSASWA